MNKGFTATRIKHSILTTWQIIESVGIHKTVQSQLAGWSNVRFKLQIIQSTTPAC